ncbi:MAG: hypothetical protein APF76_04560 [Desulfitibacter sp. BRH_c19]|nr:MAG: hypothetical protein APF76_04560 [Desulfitibacter sp. BRH_c19]
MDFNKSKFAQLLTLAKGERSINKYGNDAGVDPGYISRLLRELIDTAPSAAIIIKLASKAYNEVSAEQLLAAAGYLNDSQNDLLDCIPPEGLMYFRKLKNLPPDAQKEFLEAFKQHTKLIEQFEKNKNKKD